MKTLLPKEQTWDRSKYVRRDERFLSLAQIDKLYHLRPNSFVYKLVEKILVGNYELIRPMGICEKIFLINLHNLQMLFMLWIKYTFSECLAPLHKHEGPQWKTFLRRFCPGPQTRGHSGTAIRKYFCGPQILLWSEKFVLNIW